jgi:hypothetical protein
MQLPATFSLPVIGPSCQYWPSTRTLIRFNRALAWGLVLSPLIQIATGVSFWRGLWFDVALLLVHGGLSLKLFGAPKTAKTSTDRNVLLISGISPRAVSPRNKLLLSGYRVLLGTAYTLGLIVAVQMQTLLPWLAPVVLTVGIYAVLRMPFSSLGHLYVASDYAAKRWGIRYASELLALCIAVTFAVASFINLLRV